MLLGPAFVAAVAYVDPGNVAANLTAGAEYGYLLVWVLVVSNAMAVLIQYLSAKLGLVTGRSLPELLGARLRRGTRLTYWGQAEVVAAATDLAEVIGGAIALNLLFGLPLVWGGLITGAVSMVLLAVHSRKGQRPFEFVIIGFLAVIAVGFLAGLFVSPVDWAETAGGLVPRFADSGTVLLAASMLGATVMPHAIYLHSALARDRHLPGQAGADIAAVRVEPREISPAAAHAVSAGHGDVSTSAQPGDPGVPCSSDDPAEPGPGGGASTARLPLLLRATKVDVLWSLVIAGSVNIAMLLLAAASLRGVGGTDTIAGAHAAIEANLGPVIGVVFAVGLLASGLAATSVGAYAGAVIMGGLLHRRIPLLTRRLVTLVPALVVIALGADPTWALVLSQVVLSLGIPFALIPLVRLTNDPAVMGEHASGLPLRVTGWAVVAAIVALNIALIVITATGG
ncbi:Nramp family divalent metal transporter [Demequina aestuarii]|uniref:Nramp family divalent metal transporter n=1 Tax=Demequina aestuarii TaxID=327095 RepID=UPI001930F518|nr:Nramp family divalent metal transporter [Demequina aestuarii]